MKSQNKKQIPPTNGLPAYTLIRSDRRTMEINVQSITAEIVIRIPRRTTQKTAEDFLRLFEAMPDPNRSVLLPKKTFLGFKPLTAQEMYVHTRCVNSYYFGEIHVDADQEGTILACRQRGFDALEQQENFLSNPVFPGSGDEYWSLRKVLRRFIWHDRIHAKAMYRMAEKTFGEGSVPDIFRFFG